MRITGSYLQTILSLPILPAISSQASLMSALNGTPGSMSFPYGVMVTWKTVMWPIEDTSLMWGTMGLGSLVMKIMQSTLRLVRSTRCTVVRETGLRTSA